MLLLVGLGNPGAKYAGNRHNIGFMAVDALARAYKAGPWKKKFRSEVAEASIDGVRTLLMKPQTFYNDSGHAVAEASRFWILDENGVRRLKCREEMAQLLEQVQPRNTRVKPVKSTSVQSAANG